MATRGRPRKEPANLPGHIDYSKVPKGVYWDNSGRGRWYVLNPHPEGRGYKAKTVAQATARLSDLHVIAEQRSGVAVRGTISYVIDLFEGSLTFAQLASTTQQHYRDYAKAIRLYPLKNGTMLGDAVVDRLTPGVIRRLVDVIAHGRPAEKPGQKDVPGYPTKANHWLRYLRRVFGWAREHDHVQTNPASGVKQVKERRAHRMPKPEVFRAVQAYARECSTRGPREKGAVPLYLWAAMELAYQARLRGIEVLTLTDAHDVGQELMTNRRKGSRDNLVRKGGPLTEAIQALQTYRFNVWQRQKRPVPLDASERYLFVGEDGGPLTRSGFNTSWQRLMKNALRDGVLVEADRFALHGLKHRGVTDTDGDKKLASGHKTDAMLHVYDHSLPVVSSTSGSIHPVAAYTANRIMEPDK
ncbi:site-specific integrase [Xanthomonas vesicatoria]|nr:integrase [Xanthomonas vesicatoria]MCC8560288.1 integrase [Xanthomonas vesicatoria]MCC8595568.1 integrase [Xanthomonas vesicatoria]MCC8602817.1 integrase [Xanthomonas vesicatoria]MCC8604380.1 integrase [Xanthomonas vesicatoria]MCC8610030.1 integrase [Xanthomonas vesicatoria]